MAAQASRCVSVDDAVAKLRRIGEAPVVADGGEAAVRGLLLLDEVGVTARRVLAQLRRSALDSGAAAIAEGQCEPEVRAPYAPFGDIVRAVVDWLGPSESALLHRYAAPIVGVLPALAGAELFRDAVLPQAGMAAYCFRGHAHELHEFFQGRNVSPWMIDEIVRFLLDASESERAARQRLIVVCHEMQDASPQALRIFRLLGRYGRRRPLMVCGVFRATSSFPAVHGLAPSGDFEVVPLPSEEFDPELIEAARQHLPVDGQQLLSACACLRRPADPDEAAAVAGLNDRDHVKALLKELAVAGLVETWANGRIVVPRDVRAVIDVGIRPDARCQLSEAALRLAATSGDAYECAYHASEAGTADAADLIRPAVERAWDVSAYPTAVYYAQRFIAAGATGLGIDPRLLLFFLYSEAGDGAAADAQIAAASAEASDPPKIAFLNHLRGYNATFVLRDMEVGLLHFRLVLDHAKHGPLPNLPWIKNSMAFALNQLGRTDEALALEEEALASSGPRARRDRFLSTILHLNLGRLHRPRSLDRANELIRTSIDNSAGELTLHHLLLSYMTFENLHRWKGSPSDALAFLRLSVSLFNDEGVAFSKRVFPLISRTFADRIGALDDDRILRSDQVRLCVALNLALAHEELGHEQQAATYREWLRWRLMDLCEPGLAALVSTDHEQSREVGDASRPDSSDPPAVGGTVEQLERHANLVRVKAESNPARSAGEALADGRAVAWLRTDHRSQATVPFDSVLLMDPRVRRSPAQMMRDFRQEDAMGAILAAPQGADWFVGVDSRWSLVPQEGTLRKQFRDLAPGVPPVRARVYVLAREGRSELAEIIARVHERTGIPLAVMLPFRVFGEEIATTVEAAVKYFFETDIDVLLCNSVLVEKRHGAAASENLAVLKPALCGVLVNPKPGAEAGHARGVFVSRDRRVSVGSRGRRLLEQCDGERTIAQLAASDGGAEDVYGFFRRVRSEGMVRFML